MRQTAVAGKELGGGMCEVRVRRASACGGECASCGMGEACSSMVTAKAENSVGARPGDLCVVETPSGTIGAVAMLVYLLPAVLAIVLGVAAELLRVGLAPVGVAVGLVIGIIVARLTSRARREDIPVRIVEVLSRAVD